MSASPSELLAQHARGVLTREALQSRLRALAQADVAQLQRWIVELQSDVAVGRISPTLANSVLDTLTGADDHTQVGADPTLTQAKATLIRTARFAAPSDTELTEAKRAPRDADATTASPPEPTVVARMDEGITQRKPSDTTERKADRTERKAADATERKALSQDGNEATQRQIIATLKHSPDATVRINAPATAARTLRAPDEAQPLPDRTEIIADRLVKSLENTDDPHHGQLQPGTVIKKRFVLDSLIGKGGMGLVFSAIDRRKEEAQDPNPRVALKVLNADFRSHPQSLIALQREARKAQTLAHPNVVTVFDFDRDGDAVYMTMELLKGRALEKLVKEARGVGTDPAIALPIIRGIAEGLAYAHRKGIVHSDLKPGNVFVLDDGTPKILDFGIARAVPNSAATAEADVFDAGMLGAYTEAYATHEMVEGVDPHPADDMYSLGIIAYELLTGFHPYQRHSAPKARELGIKPPPLKGLKLRESRALERCLSFDRNDRPKDAAEFLKLFRGVTALQKALIVATVVLTLAAGYSTYEYYREAGPAVPFSQLPAQQQESFAAAMKGGDEFYAFYTRESNQDQLLSAIIKYAEAYATHPRNRDASAALKKSGDALLGLTQDAAQRHEAAQWLLTQSDFYKRYPPVAEAGE